MSKLSKSEFMHKIINDIYAKKLADKEKLNSAYVHSLNNFNKIKRRLNKWLKKNGKSK